MSVILILGFFHCIIIIIIIILDCNSKIVACVVNLQKTFFKLKG